MEFADFTAWQTSMERTWSDEALDSSEPHWAESLWGNGGEGPWPAVGLIERWADPCDDTPAGAEVLFRSGVDGVHWSTMPAADGSGSLLVMTVPGALQPNLILGESLEEFLALGCQLGFWNLGALGHDVMPAPICAEDATAQRILTEMARGLSLEPWPDVPARLAQLTEMHGRPRPRYVPPEEPLDPAFMAAAEATMAYAVAHPYQGSADDEPIPGIAEAMAAGQAESLAAMGEWKRLRDEWRREQDDSAAGEN